MSGLLYSFDLVSTGGCGNTDQEGTTCHMEVYTVPWKNSTEILWNKSTCIKNVVIGAKEEVEVDQTIVDFVMSELSYGDCQKNSVKVENFHKQVDCKIWPSYKQDTLQERVFNLFISTRLLLVFCTPLTWCPQEAVETPMQSREHVTWRCTVSHGGTQQRSSGTSLHASSL